MGKQKLETTQELKRIAALPYNPNFQDEVKKLRQKYGILIGLQACDYLEKHPDLVSHLIEDVRNVVSRYTELWPSEVFRKVMLYVLTDNCEQFKESLNHTLPTPQAKRWRWDTTPGCWAFTITGISKFATKEQWDEIWYYEVLPRLKAIKEVFGIPLPAKKRPNIESFNEEMKRYSEWYQLSEIEGLGPTQALDKWLEDHQDERDKYNVSTLTHAIKEFREVIKPLPTKD